MKTQQIIPEELYDKMETGTLTEKNIAERTKQAMLKSLEFDAFLQEQVGKQYKESGYNEQKTA
ncbi:MAG: hypothetical protein LBU27_02685 [Candidatus Peribacteria bacterium]|jgi:phosphoserine phosphatase|nr:hypothetical protein [Candidatus Peribacteria bacterium]